MVRRGQRSHAGPASAMETTVGTLPFVRNSGGGRSGTSASTGGAGSLTSLSKNSDYLTGVAKQGGTEASPGHETRTLWTPAGLRQQTASALGHHYAVHKHRGQCVDVCRSRANAHPDSQHHAIATSAVLEDIARPDIVFYASFSPQERWHGGQVKAHLSAIRGPQVPPASGNKSSKGLSVAASNDPMSKHGRLQLRHPRDEQVTICIISERNARSPRVSNVLLMVVHHDIRAESIHEINAISRCAAITVPAPRALANWIPMKPVPTWPAVTTTVGFEVQERPLPADTASWSLQQWGSCQLSPATMRKV